MLEPVVVMQEKGRGNTRRVDVTHGYLIGKTCGHDVDDCSVCLQKVRSSGASMNRL